MNCNTCDTLGTKDDPLTVCDQCRVKECQSCSRLSTTEYRAVVMKSRVILYHCSACRPTLTSASGMTGREIKATLSAELTPIMDKIGELDIMLNSASFKDSLLHQLRRDFSAITNSLEQRIVSELQQKISAVSDEVSTLKQSNIDLVRLLTNRPSPVGTIESSRATQEKPQSGSNRGGPGKRVPPPTTKVSTPKPGVGACAAYSTVGSSMPCDPQSHSLSTAGNSASLSVNTSNNTRPPVIVGSRKMQGSRLTAAIIQKKTSIFVSRLDKHVSTDDLTGYLQTTFGAAETFTVEEQKVRSGDYRSFRVEVRLELLDRLLCANNWPENILIKKFRFPRAGMQASK